MQMIPENTRKLSAYARIGRTMRKIPNVKIQVVDGRVFVRYTDAKYPYCIRWQEVKVE